MITDAYYKKRMFQYHSEFDAFRIVYDFLEEKIKNAESQGDTDKKLAYQEVFASLLNRHEKMIKEMTQLKNSYEHQQKRR